MSVSDYTYTVHADINVSTAFRYETGGNAACDLACWVDNVKRDVTPSVTRAGAASGFIQNETHYNIVKFSNSIKKYQNNLPIYKTITINTLFCLCFLRI